MRLFQLLLEYDQNKTLELYGVKLFDQYVTRRGERTPDGQFRNGDIGHVFKTLGAMPVLDEQPAIKLRIAKHIISRWFEHFDPSPNKQYMIWLVNRYIGRMGPHEQWQVGINLLEDLPKAHDFLEQYIEIKNSGYFKRNKDDPKIAPLADINAFKTLSDLGAFVMNLNSEQLMSNTAKDKALRAQMDILVDDARYLIAIPKTEEAACYLGRNTQWCTAAKTGNMFSTYNEHGPLYVVVDKKNNRRWQFHFPTGQFMNERDEAIDPDDAPDIWRYNIFPYDQMKQEELVVICANPIWPDFVIDDQVLPNMDKTSLLVLWLQTNRPSICQYWMKRFKSDYSTAKFGDASKILDFTSAEDFALYVAEQWGAREGYDILIGFGAFHECTFWERTYENLTKNLRGMFGQAYFVFADRHVLATVSDKTAMKTPDDQIETYEVGSGHRLDILRYSQFQQWLTWNNADYLQTIVHYLKPKWAELANK